MSISYVSTLDDPRLDCYARLTDVALRSRIEPEKAILIAESAKVIERAFEAGLEPLSLLMEEKWLEPLADLISAMTEHYPDLEVLVAPHEELAQLTGFELTRGALAAFRRPRPLTVAEALDQARLVAVLENITNHTNVGAIFRSAAALGVDAVLVSPACYDPWYRRAVCVSMGTVFQIPWARIGSDPHHWAREGLGELHDLGFTTAAMALSDHAITLDELAAATGRRPATGSGSADNAGPASPTPVALLFGTEGEGLNPETLAQCDHTVCIPMDHGVDSLNVAAASAVAFYALRA